MNERRAGDVVPIESFTAQPQAPAFAILAGALRLGGKQTAESHIKSVNRGWRQLSVIVRGFASREILQSSGRSVLRKIPDHISRGHFDSILPSCFTELLSVRLALPGEVDPA